LATVLLGWLSLVARGRWLVGECSNGQRDRKQNQNGREAVENAVDEPPEDFSSHRFAPDCYEQSRIIPDCGMKYIPRELAFAKL
jgi:hypothetical protein